MQLKPTKWEWSLAGRRLRASVAVLTLVAGCGGKASADAAAAGAADAGTDVAALLDAAQDADDAGNVDDATVQDATVEADVYNPTPLDCAARGGTCALLSSMQDSCPSGTYDPFSGQAAYCPTNSIRRCCVPMGDVGPTCTQAAPCNGGGCLDEQAGYPTGGFCTHACSPGGADCPAWAVCIPVMFSQAAGTCMVACASNDACRDGESCQAFPKQPFQGNGDTVYVCWQPNAVMGGKGLGEACTSDNDCMSARCRTNPADGTGHCSSSCGTGAPCLPGYLCDGSSGSCFPK